MTPADVIADMTRIWQRLPGKELVGLATSAIGDLMQVAEDHQRQIAALQQRVARLEQKVDRVR